MREQDDGGRLILISSPAGQRGNFGQTNYAAAKAGIVAMARTWAMELAQARDHRQRGRPGRRHRDDEDHPRVRAADRGGREGRRRRCRTGCAGTRASARSTTSRSLIVFLASDAADGVTGQAIGIGGDRLALWAHPQEKAVAFADGGWTPEAIAESWHAGVGARAGELRHPRPGRAA